MNKAYLIAPLAALAVFVAIFLNFKSGYVAREKAREEQIAAARQDKLKAEVDARNKALADNLVIQAQRKKEREAKEAADKVRKEARQAAIDARDKAFHDQDQLAKQIDGLKKDIADEQEALAKIARDKKDFIEQQAFLKTYIEKAEANAQALSDVLLKIDAAERARIAAEAAAKKTS